MTIQTKTAIFNRLSKNALQNVMEYFDYKGTDFVQMRCINRKTKNAYMQHLQNKFNAERYFLSLDATQLDQNKEIVNEFKQSCKVLKWEYSLDVEPRVPSLKKPKSILPTPQDVMLKLVELVTFTEEFPYHDDF